MPPVHLAFPVLGHRCAQSLTPEIFLFQWFTCIVSYGIVFLWCLHRFAHPTFPARGHICAYSLMTEINVPEWFYCIVSCRFFFYSDCAGSHAPVIFLGSFLQNCFAILPTQTYVHCVSYNRAQEHLIIDACNHPELVICLLSFLRNYLHIFPAPRQQKIK